jgi:hypothetical protein
MNDLFNDRPEGSDEAEAEKGEAGDDEDEIQFDEEDFFNYFDQTIEKLNEAKASSFPEENKNDTYRRRKKQMNKLYLTGRFNDIKGEFARKVLGNEYRIYTRPSNSNTNTLLRLYIFWTQEFMSTNKTN